MEISGITHCHSTYSYDAKLSLPELKKLLQKKGLKFACMTEHTDELTKERAVAFVDECRALSNSSFLFIPGFEVPYKHAHILMIGMPEFLETYAPTLAALKEWVKKTWFVVLAHPVRNQFLVEDGLLELIDGLEVWNQQYDGKRVPRTRSLSLLQSLRKRKPTLFATGGVDLHRSEHEGAPIVTMTVEKLDEVSVLEKLTTGAYTVHSERATFFGTIPNISALKRKHFIESLVSVSIIVLGKFVNKVFAQFGLSLPKSLKQRIRARL